MWTILCDRDHWLPILITILHTINRVAESTGGTFLYGLNDGFYLGGIESWFAGQHYEIVLPSAGGENKVEGDYLFRDHMGLGNAGGLWGIVRVTPEPAP